MSAPLVDIARSGKDVDQAFPTLTADQIARIASHGRTRRVEAGEVLQRAGKLASLFFVVSSGRLAGLVPTGPQGETTITDLGPGQFTGEVAMLAGRPAIATLRVAESGELIEVGRDEL